MIQPVVTTARTGEHCPESGIWKVVGSPTTTAPIIEFNALELLKGQSRPHYLVGKGTYEKLNDKHKLNVKAFFPSSRDSIKDRIKTHIPHVNTGDAFFGYWNSIHILTNYVDFSYALVTKGEYRNLRLIPIDTEIDLEVLLETHTNPMKKSEFDIKLKCIANYYHDKKRLMKFIGTGVAKSVGI